MMHLRGDVDKKRIQRRIGVMPIMLGGTIGCFVAACSDAAGVSELIDASLDKVVQRIDRMDHSDTHLA